MSDPITPTSHDADDTDPAERTRVRRRMIRGEATLSADGGIPTEEPSPPRGRPRSRPRPAIADPFVVKPASTDLGEAVSLHVHATTDAPADVITGDEASEVDTSSREVVADLAPDQVAESAPAVASQRKDDEEQAAPRKRRRGGRGRRGRGRGEAEETTAEAASTGDIPAEDMPAEDMPAEDMPAEDMPAADGAAEDAEPAEDWAAEVAEPVEDWAAEVREPADDDDAAAEEWGEDSWSSGDTGSEDDAASDEAGGPADDGGSGSEDDEDDDGHGAGSRRRRRGRRGRGRRSVKAGGDVPTAPAESSPGSTRLTARVQRSGGGGRRRIPTVSPETRRVMAESPPKRMLVTVGTERTQIAVLEERTLVEHYVTQASEASYVGNIYKGRVQNVLPGMEAAFVDIGKGRNGVLYAGEVNYDEADRDGGLPRIEQALKPGQTVMVQVTKDPMGTKGARLTQHLSLAGRYCVLAPGDDMLGISRKLPDDQRERLRKILKGLKPEGYGLIVRTAAESATAEQLEADVKRLIERWHKVEEKADAAKVLEPVYAEPQLVLRVIRDVFGPEHTQLIINDAELAEQVKEYLEEVSPEHVDKVVVYEGEGRMFDAYEVTVQIRRALEKKVWLKSGGYLIIEKTEAMWVIDVNTGKFVGKDNLEETVLRNNIEAAVEIARQLRLRDMGGIIVIDFVDMIVPANRDEVLKRFKRELARDKTKSRVMEISKLGLVQMTRKNVSKGLMESFTEETDDAIPGRRIVEDLLA